MLNSAIHFFDLALVVIGCGMPWTDEDGPFTPGRDHLIADDGPAACALLCVSLADRDMAMRLAARGPATVRARHLCMRHVDELLPSVNTLHAEDASRRRNPLRRSVLHA